MVREKVVLGQHNNRDTVGAINLLTLFKAGVGNSFGFAGTIRDNLGIRGPVHIHVN